MLLVIALYVPLFVGAHHDGFDKSKWRPYRAAILRGVQLRPVTVRIKKELIFVNGKPYNSKDAVYVVKQAVRLVPSPPILLSARMTDKHRAVAFSKIISATGVCDVGRCYFYLSR